MEIYIYAIRSLKDGRIYVGQTSSIERRLKQHNSGLAKSTKSYKPWRLLYSESRSNRVEARKLETYFKSSRGKVFLKKLGARSSIG